MAVAASPSGNSRVGEEIHDERSGDEKILRGHHGRGARHADDVGARADARRDSRPHLCAQQLRIVPLARQGDAPLAIAPPFRTLGRRYPIDSLAESLAEGIMTGHPTMPTFQLDPGQINDLLSFMKTLQQ